MFLHSNPQFGVYQIVFGFLEMMIELDGSGSTSSTAGNGTTSVFGKALYANYDKVYHS